MTSNAWRIVGFNCLPNAVLGLVNEFIDLRDLWMTCRELWQSEARREIVYLKLTAKFSEKFLKDKIFREVVKTSTVFPNKQISLRLAKQPIQNVDELGCVHALDLCDCRGVVDVSALGNVHTLYLSGCSGVVDVSALSNVHTLDLSGCSGVVDVSALGNVHTLYLSGCHGVVDVRALGNVHTLHLDNMSDFE